MENDPEISVPPKDRKILPSPVHMVRSLIVIHVICITAARMCPPLASRWMLLVVAS